MYILTRSGDVSDILAALNFGLGKVKMRDDQGFHPASRESAGAQWFSYHPRRGWAIRPDKEFPSLGNSAQKDETDSKKLGLITLFHTQSPTALNGQDRSQGETPSSPSTTSDSAWTEWSTAKHQQMDVELL